MSKVLILGELPILNTEYGKMTKNVELVMKEKGYEVIHLSRFLYPSDDILKKISEYPTKIYSTTMRLANPNGEIYDVIIKSGLGSEIYYNLMKLSMVELPISRGVELSMADEDYDGYSSLSQIVSFENIDIVIVVDDIAHCRNITKIINKIPIPIILWTNLESDFYLNNLSYANVFTEVWVSNEKQKEILSNNKIESTIKVIPLPIDVNNLGRYLEGSDTCITREEIRKEIGIDNTWFVMLATGRNTSKRNIVSSIDILNDLIKNEKDQQIHLIIYTSANEGPNLEEYAQKYNLKDRVHIIKYDTTNQPNLSELGKLYKSADVFVNTATTSGYCIDKDSYILTPKGPTHVSNLQIGDHVYGQKSVNTILNIEKIHVENDPQTMYNINLDNNQNLAQTEDHFITFDIGLNSTVGQLYDIYKNKKNNEIYLELILPYQSHLPQRKRNCTLTAKPFINGLFTFDVSYKPTKSLHKDLRNKQRKFMIRALLGLKKFSLTKYESPTFDIDVTNKKTYGDEWLVRNTIFTELFPYSNIYGRVKKTALSTYCDTPYMLTKHKLRDKPFYTIFSQYVTSNFINKWIVDDEIAQLIAHSLLASKIKYTIHKKGRRVKFTLNEGEDLSVLRKVKFVKRYEQPYIKVNSITKKTCDTYMYAITVDNDKTFNINGIVLTNCIPMLEGLSCGVVSLSSPHWSEQYNEILYSIYPKDGKDTDVAVLDYTTNTKKYYYNTKEIVNIITELYNGKKSNIMNVMLEAQDFVNNNNSIVAVANKIDGLPTSKEKLNDQPLVPICLISKPLQEYAQTHHDMILSLKPKYIMAGHDEKEVKTTSISKIWVDGVALLSDDTTYVIAYSLYDGITKTVINRLYKEYTENNMEPTVATIKNGNMDMTGYTIEDSSLKPGIRYINIGLLIAKGKDIKGMKLTKYKTDSLLIVDNESNTIHKCNHISIDGSTAYNDSWYPLDVAGVLFKELGYETKYLLPGMRIFENIKLSGVAEGIALYNNMKIPTSEVYSWIYPNTSQVIHSLEQLIKICNGHSQSFITIPDGFKDTVDWKVGGLKLSKVTDTKDKIKYIIACDNASEAGIITSSNTVVCCENLDQFNNPTQYIVGQTMETVRKMFPSAKVTTIDQYKKMSNK